MFTFNLHLLGLFYLFMPEIMKEFLDSEMN